MWTLLESVRRARRGAVAVEFALTFLPVLYLFAGVTNIGLAYYQEVAISNAVGAAAQYAEVNSETSAPVTEADVEAVLTDAAKQSMPDVTVHSSAVCYGFPVTTTTWTANASDKVSCSGGTCVTSSTTIKYVEITGYTTYEGILPWSWMGEATTFSPTLSKTAWIPLGC